MSLLKPIQNVFLRQDYNIGKINLVVLHGLMGSKTNFKNLVNSTQISKHLKSAYLLDARQDIRRYGSNHGDSPQTQTMSYEEMACDLRHFIANHHLDNVVLLGHSMGGRIIFSYLESFPNDRPLGNVIVDVGPGEGEGKNYVKKLQEIDLKNKSLKDIQDNILEVLRNKEMTQLIMTNLVATNKEATNVNYVWRLNIESISEFQRQGHKEFRSTYDGPVCVICGERSDYVNQNDRASFLQVFPKIDINKDIHFIAGAGHWVQVEKPREFINLTSQYLSQF